WALKDINLEIQQGDRVGIIGRNGAGKSTLLKILSRITEPTSGRVTIKGRVASLLEVGTGFHPELTGRENVFLNGAILGMSRVEIKKKFDEIVDFSGVEKFLDTPVKRYSSGMYVRLAFAVAAHLEPEILLIDEVLAVGDAEFQKKCIGKMEEVGKGGRTLLFVSHNMGMIKNFCNKGILLFDGELSRCGELNNVVQGYFSLENDLGTQGEINWQPDNAPGNEEMGLRRIRLLGPDGFPHEEFDADWPIKIEITFQINFTIRGMRIILSLIKDFGLTAFASTNENVSASQELTPGIYKTYCTIPENILNTGKYLVNIHSGIPTIKVLSMGKEYLSFSVVCGSSLGTFRTENWPGVVAPKLTWDYYNKITNYNA
ncbi:MAG: ABC transporter ATP-binding protein, partial [Desulfobacteraceae bacterium]|nr:ABC transporter ATP-binding protein [Desulfobacteraceae bacterium]